LKAYGTVEVLPPHSSPGGGELSVPCIGHYIPRKRGPDMH
jgi:hypothetical protein